MINSHWKEKLEEVNYIGDEESYIDDFLLGLKSDLVVRVWTYKSKPLRLLDAFYRARLEESLISLTGISRDNNDKLFDEMSYPKSVYIAKFQGTTGVSEENGDDVLDAPCLITAKEDFGSMRATTTTNSVKDVGGGLGDSARTTGETANSIDEEMANGVCKVINKMSEPILGEVKATEYVIVDQATLDYAEHKVFNEITEATPAGLQSVSSLYNMSEAIFIFPTDQNYLFDEKGQLNSLKPNGLKDTQHMFDEMPERHSVELGEVPERIWAELNEERYVIQDFIFPFDAFKFDVEICYSKVIMLVFDSGGRRQDKIGGEILTFMKMIWAIFLLIMKTYFGSLQGIFSYGALWLVSCLWRKKIQGDHKRVILIRATTLENFMWDSGLCAIFVYILEDKGCF